MSKQLRQPAAGDTVATIKTNMGDIKVVLFPDAAPKAVENFTTHAENGYYDGVIFHRVIPDFMIQGGDPLGKGIGGESIWGKPFKDEFSRDYHNLRGRAVHGERRPEHERKSVLYSSGTVCRRAFYSADGASARYVHGRVR